jgi:hypothetical protein
MRFRVLLQGLGLAIVLGLTLATTAVGAAGNQSNQDQMQPAMLVAPDPDFQISVYAKPEPQQRRIGYGWWGDRVTVLEQVGSNAGYTWNPIKFEAGTHLEGWVQSNFIAIQSTEKQPIAKPSQAPEGNARSQRLGNRYSGYPQKTAQGNGPNRRHPGYQQQQN